MAEPPNPTPIYRLVHADNLPVLLQRQALHSPNHTPADGVAYRTIHRVDVQESRQQRLVPKGPGGNVHDYVAFYFGPRSVMLYQLHTGWVPGYTDGQEPLIHLVSTCQAVERARGPFVFSDGHGLARFTAWYDTLADLTNVDWEAAYARQWNDTPEQMDRQRRKQAEFLVHQRCPWHLLTEIGVYDDAARLRVQSELNKAPQDDQIPVHVKPEWYC